MSNKSDEIAIEMLEKAVAFAKEELVSKGEFKPFGIVFDKGVSEMVKNRIKNPDESYDKICEEIESIIANRSIDIVIFAIDANIPEKFAQNREDEPKSSIRLHIEEKSQVHRVLSARYIYIPYQLYKDNSNEMFIKLYSPLPIGLKAEYITKEKDNIELI